MPVFQSAYLDMVPTASGQNYIRHYPQQELENWTGSVSYVKLVWNGPTREVLGKKQRGPSILQWPLSKVQCVTARDVWWFLSEGETRACL